MVQSAPISSLDLPLLAQRDIEAIARGGQTPDLEAGEEARRAADILKKMGYAVPEPLQQLVAATGPNVSTAQIFLEHPETGKVYKYYFDDGRLRRRDEETELESGFAADYWTTYGRKDWRMTELATDGADLYVLLTSPDEKNRVVGKLADKTIMFDRCWLPMMNPQGLTLIGAKVFAYGEHATGQSAMIDLTHKIPGKMLCY